jgi:hypothetical protein
VPGLGVMMPLIVVRSRGDGLPRTLGTGFGFDIEIVRGAGAFVCGEETALMRSVERERGEPRQRPPYPVQKGIDGKHPTLTPWPGYVREFLGAAAVFRVSKPRKSTVPQTA